MGTASFTVEYELGGKTALNVGYLVHDALTVADFQAMADNIASNWAANIMPSLSNECELKNIEVKGIDSVIQVTSNSGFGTLGGSAVPSESVLSALVITKADGTSRRKGRWFIPGVPDDRVFAGGSIDAGWASNVAAQFQVSQLNLNPVNNAFMANKHRVGAGDLYVPIESFGFSPLIGKQGRRRFG